MKFTTLDGPGRTQGDGVFKPFPHCQSCNRCQYSGKYHKCFAGIGNANSNKLLVELPVEYLYHSFLHSTIKHHQVLDVSGVRTNSCAVFWTFKSNNSVTVEPFLKVIKSWIQNGCILILSLPLNSLV